MKTLLYNAYQTPDGTILHSKSVHDFVSHKDKVNGKTYAVDGGTAYSHIIGDHKDLKSLCVYDDGKHSTRRQYIYWGRNFDKDMNRLPATEWLAVKDLGTDHIKAILKTQPQLQSYLKRIFKAELNFRKK